jgi:lysophospholipase L1-like esterase
VTGSSSERYSKPANATDSDHRTAWTAGRPTPEQPAWIAIEIGKGPARLLLNWSASGSFNYDETVYGSPGAYRIETSSDSKDGANGEWREVASVASVGTHGGMHSFDFIGQRWVKLVVTGVPATSPNGVQIDEIDVHDVSAGAGDAWFFMGDSITAFAFGGSSAQKSRFAERVHERHPSYFPAVVNGGIGGEKTDEGVRHIESWIANNPDARFWAIGYGTNDAAGDAVDPARFKTNLEAIVFRLKRAGRVPILATIPFASDGKHPSIPEFNRAIDDVRRESSLPPGPDLYAWFSIHPEELRDGIHPNETGIGSINRLWADAVDALYPR